MGGKESEQIITSGLCSSIWLLSPGAGCSNWLGGASGRRSRSPSRESAWTRTPGPGAGTSWSRSGPLRDSPAWMRRISKLTFCLYLFLKLSVYLDEILDRLTRVQLLQPPADSDVEADHDIVKRGCRHDIIVRSLRRGWHPLQGLDHAVP